MIRYGAPVCEARAFLHIAQFNPGGKSSTTSAFEIFGSCLAPGEVFVLDVAAVAKVVVVCGGAILLWEEEISGLRGLVAEFVSLVLLAEIVKPVEGGIAWAVFKGETAR